MFNRWSSLLCAALVLAFPGLAWAAPAASFAPSRAAGVAPLAVFFDASASTCAGCAGVTDAWHDLAYQWDFSDPGAGDWALSGRSKATDLGPSAAHVFEAPGSYAVKLTITDPVSGQSATVTHTIDVADPDVAYAGASTYCYRASAGGAFTGCPAGAQQKTNADFVAAFAECKGAGHRCLFRRGDTFTAAKSLTLDATAPGLIGAFGTGAKPLVDASGLGPSRLFSGGSGGQDYRVVDLTLKGASVKYTLIYGASYPQLNALFLRVDGVPSTWHNFALMDQSQLTVKDWHKNIFLVDCTISKVGFGNAGSNGGNVLYITYKDSAILGNDFEDTLAGEHVIRAAAYDNLLIAHNRLGGAHAGKHVITLRSADANVACVTPVCAPSKKGQLRANTLYVSSPWTVQVCGQVGTENNQCEDTLVDGNFGLRNHAYPLSGIQPVFFNLGDQTSKRTTFRNNICNLTDAASRCADLKVSSLARALGNTCYRSDGDDMQCINTFGSPAAGVSALAQNNLAFGVGGVVKAVTGSWSASDHNLVPAASPFAVAMPSASPDEYKLKAGVAAVDGGVASPNHLDFGGHLRPFGAAPDVGAWEYGAGNGAGAVQVTLSTPTNPAAAGAAFSLLATTSGGNGTPAFTWDCDHDGIFEKSTGAVASVMCPGLPAGVYSVGVRVTDLSGSAVDTLSLDVEDSCGDGVREGSETCDGADLAGQSCASFGFTGGALACSPDCATFVTSGCTGAGGTCGDAVCAGSESPDGCFADCGQIGDVSVYDSTVDPEVLLYEVWTGETIDYSMMASKSLGVIADCKAPCSGVAFVLDGSYADPRTTGQNTAPFSMGGDNGKWYFGVGCPNGGPCANPIPTGAHHITFFPCSDDFGTFSWASEAELRAACKGVVGQPRDVAFMIVDGPPPSSSSSGGGGAASTGSVTGAGGAREAGSGGAGGAGGAGKGGGAAGCSCEVGGAGGASRWSAAVALLLLGCGARRRARGRAS